MRWPRIFFVNPRGPDFTKLYKNRRNLCGFGCLIFLHTPENNRVSKEKR
jgi:hypothetical protein